MKTNGFTLIEMLIVVAVIGILSAIAVPSYNQYVIRAKVSEGLQLLAGAKLPIDQYYQDNGTYLNGANCGGTLPANTSNFTFACAAVAAAGATPESYKVTMKGVTTSSVKSYEYTLTDRGIRATTAHPTRTDTACWVQPNGSC